MVFEEYNTKKVHVDDAPSEDDDFSHGDLKLDDQNLLYMICIEFDIKTMITYERKNSKF